ncbi:MAG: hypothetical protein V2A64_07230 [Candidatus Omnitrophota bacterium]
MTFPAGRQVLPILGAFRSPSRFDLGLAIGGQTLPCPASPAGGRQAGTAHWLVRSKSGGGLGKIVYTFLCC